LVDTEVSILVFSFRVKYEGDNNQNRLENHKLQAALFASSYKTPVQDHQIFFRQHSHETEAKIYSQNLITYYCAMGQKSIKTVMIITNMHQGNLRTHREV